MQSIENGARGFAGSIAQPTDDFQIGVNEALLFSNNGRVMQEFLNDGGGSLLARLKEIKEPKAAIDYMVRSVMCRPANGDEIMSLCEYVQRRGDRLPEAYKQVLWAMVSSAEFRFNY
jgi:hypothetical protein